MKIRKYIPDGHLVIMIDTKTGFGFEQWNNFRGIEFKEIGILDLNNNPIFVGDIVNDPNYEYYVIEESAENLCFIMRHIETGEVKMIPRKNNVLQISGQIYLPETYPKHLKDKINFKKDVNNG